MKTRALFFSALLVPSLSLLACESSPELSPSGDGDGVNVGDGDGDRGGDGDGDGDISLGGGPGGDGDGDGGDGDGDAPQAVCGNGELEPGELCDDGGTDDGDGCEGDCQSQDPDYDCSEPGEPCVNTIICGNGVIEGDEACDDGDTRGGDGCSADCDEVEEGYECARPGVDCVELPVCGNGTRERGEQCDDGETDPDDGDGCDSSCQLEDGYFCPPGQECIFIECGDGYRTPDEECDDDNLNDGDGCSADCEIEEGWICSQSGCKGICGDGFVVGAEQCDDANLITGDGCSAACRVEPFYSCDDSEPSDCSTDIVCGNAIVDPGEVCDPGGADGVPLDPSSACYGPSAAPSLACRAFDSGLVDPPVCGNNVVEFQEGCDSATGTFTGCTECEVDDGYVCPAPGVCFLLPDCGDGILQSGEECDLGLMSGPGCIECEIQDDYFCSGEPSDCVQSICGDGFRAPDEACDDGPGTLSNPGTPVSGDGCSNNCNVETGWVCPPGINCQPVCGDFVVEGNEECDVDDDDACINCRVQPGYDCGNDGEGPCDETVCGNGDAEPGEGCDDGNTIAGDGCGPTCQIEPTFTRNPAQPYPTPIANVTCGDGLITGDEDCDDGNDIDGDGCTNCDVDDGYTCDPILDYPDEVVMQVTYRDWRRDDVDRGHPDFERGISAVLGLPGPVCTTTANAKCVTDAGVACPANTCGHLDTQGKPVWHGTGGGQITSANSFATWYRNGTLVAGQTNVYDNTYGVMDVSGGTQYLSRTAVFTDSMVLESVDGSPGTYRFDNDGDDLFPLNGRGLDTTGTNYHFTTELRYFFQYQGGETLTFRGDVDVWVFVNGRHAVDIGGVHGAQYGRVILGDDGGYDGTGTDSNCSRHGQGSLPACTLEAAETHANDTNDTRFGLVEGGVYEIVLFHAERHTTESNFELTLAGFLAPRSFCETDCGDGIRAGNELCDGDDVPASAHDGYCVPAGQPGECTFEFCGDGIPNGDEECDNGENSDLYGAGCAPGCVFPPDCGDGELQVNFGEECDLGPGQNNGGYGGCSATCQLGPYCGDGIENGNEDCDCGADASCDFTTYADGPGECNYNCTQAPYCGDNTRNGAEICDGSANCNSMCEFDPFCGDGLQTMDEECDYGEFAFEGDPEDAPYGGCTDECLPGPYCGDETTQSEFGEECDFGELNQGNVYEGCTEACLWGPYCGDGVHQPEAGEACDNGFNEDVYAYSESACGEDCSPVPYCGDGMIQSSFELCDNGSENSDTAYNGCTTSCDWGPYCGDGELDPQETCDNGSDNTAYSADGESCGYDCEPSPYCGDGVRNGPEECDDGEENNTGGYGNCRANCRLAPYCGDGIVQASEGEQCDAGPTGSLACSPTCMNRVVVAR